MLPRPAALAAGWKGSQLAIAGQSVSVGVSTWDRIKRWTPLFIIAPSILASFIYVFVFAGWTFYISLSDSTLLPS